RPAVTLSADVDGMAQPRGIAWPIASAPGLRQSRRAMAPKPHHPLNVAGEPRAFFGRRSGKRLHRGQDALYREVLPRLAITLNEAPLDPRRLFPAAARIELEIGYGGGEHLARLAAGNHTTGFIGAEVF